MLCETRLHHIVRGHCLHQIVRGHCLQYVDLGPVLSDGEHQEPLKPDVVRKYLVDVRAIAQGAGCEPGGGSGEERWRQHGSVACSLRAAS